MSVKLMWFLLLLAGVAVPLTVCLSPLMAGGSMFHVKLLLLLTEYGLLLPIVLFLAWKRRRGGIGQDKERPSRISFRLLAAGYALVIFPVAAVLGLVAAPVPKDAVSLVIWSAPLPPKQGGRAGASAGAWTRDGKHVLTAGWVQPAGR